MRILLADSNHSVLHEMLMAEGFTCDLLWEKPADELVQMLPEYDGLVLRSKFKVTRELLEKCPRLKCIGRVGAGMENIDTAFAAEKRIVCVSAPEGNRDAVGEHALGQLLMLMNHLKKADDEVRRNVWIRAGNRGHEIAGKTVGIYGYGNMGTAFAKKLSGFDCNILAYDKYLKNFGNAYVTESNPAEIFEKADIVSLHLPYTGETHFIADKKFFASFKKPIYIINTARGKCLNTGDLVDAMKSGKVLGACLDVLEYESHSFEEFESSKMPEAFQYLLKSDRVVLSPHIAGWTHESNYKMSKIIAGKMIKALKV